MKFYGDEPVEAYCKNCGHKVVGYKSRDRTAHFACERCGTVWTSKRRTARIFDIVLHAPPGQAALY